MMNRSDEKVLKLYLKFGLTRRAIEQILELTPRHGKSAQAVIDKYGVRAAELRGRLLGCNRDQFEKVKKQLKKNVALRKAKDGHRSTKEAEAFCADAKRIVEECAPENNLGLLSAYADRALIATDPRAFYRAIKGEVANVTQKVFNPCKGIVGVCENKLCGSSRKSRQLDTAHIGQPRPSLFASSATVRGCASPLAGQAVFDLYESFRLYLRRHLSRSNRVRFLCKKCHGRLEALQKQSTSKQLPRDQRQKAKTHLKRFKNEIR